MMRVTFGTKYNQMTNNQGVLAQKMNDENTKIASGLKIQHGWQDSSLFNQDLRFAYDDATLKQGIDTAKNAQTNTLNTDKSLNEIAKAMTDFKAKLIQAASDVHTPISRGAIANDLEAIKGHIINIGNTSIGGHFIFGGSRTNTRPFDENGNYHGNNDELKALISSKTLVPYNVTGEELFFGIDSDKCRMITTNVRLLNQSKLNPAIMDQINKSDTPSEVYIKDTDTIRDLVGDGSFDTSAAGKEYFYIRGVRSNGESFKDKFAMDKSYTNPDSAAKVSDLLYRIGRSFGNTNATKVVDVRLNNWGQIEIQDLKNGSSSMDFSMISSNKDVDDISTLPRIGANVKVYTAQNLRQDFVTDSLRGVSDFYDHRLTTLPTTLIRGDNTLADKNTSLSEVLGVKTRFLKISGTPPNNRDGTVSDADLGKPLMFDTHGKSVGDLLKSIEGYFGGGLEADIDHGRINIYDMRVKNQSKDLFDPPFDGPRGFSIEIQGLDENSDSVNTFSSHLGSEYTRTFFKKNGSKLLSNVPQSIAGQSVLANGSNRLIDVVGPNINGQTYTMSLRDHNGVPVSAALHFSKQGSFLELPVKSGPGSDGDPKRVSYKIPLFNPRDEPPAVTISSGDDVTYKQFMDALGIALNYSNETDSSLRAAEVNGRDPTQQNKDAYNELLSRALGNLNVDLDSDGRLFVQDKVRSQTRMEVSVFNSNTSNFGSGAIDNSRTDIRFNANSALTIDDPKISFFKGLDESIQAVRNGIDRPGALGDGNYNDFMSNRGIQNSIELIDHLSDHIERIIAKNGAHSRSFENSVSRNEMIRTQVSGIKADTIGTDIAETYNKFNNLSNNYQAVLASTGKINQMSLTDYLK